MTHSGHLRAFACYHLSLEPSCGREQLRSRRSFLCALVGMAATAYASRRVGAEPSINASVAVGYDQPGHAISENFIGLSYESAVLASPEHLSPGNLSIMGPASRLWTWRCVTSRWQQQRAYGLARHRQ